MLYAPAAAELNVRFIVKVKVLPEIARALSLPESVQVEFDTVVDDPPTTPLLKEPSSSTRYTNGVVPLMTIDVAQDRPIPPSV
jgi:hypothetical protein